MFISFSLKELLKEFFCFSLKDLFELFFLKRDISIIFIKGDIY